MSSPPPLSSGNGNSESTFPGVPGRSFETANSTMRHSDSIVPFMQSSSSSSQATPSPTVSSSSLVSSQATSISSFASTSTMGQKAEPSVEPSISAANSTTPANPSSIDTSNKKSDEDKKREMSGALGQAGTSGRAKRTRTVLNTAEGAEQISGELNEINIIYNTGDSIGKRMTRAVKAKSDTVKHGAESASANSSQAYTMPAPNGNGKGTGDTLSNVNREPTKGASKPKRNKKLVNGEATDEQLLPNAKRQKTKAQSRQPVESKKVVPCGDAQFLWLKFQSKEVKKQASYKDLVGTSGKVKSDKYVKKEILGEKVSVPVGACFEPQKIENPEPLSNKEQARRQKTFSFKVYFPPEFGRFFSQGAVEYIHYNLDTTSHENLKLMEKIKTSMAEAKKKGEKFWFETMEDF
ncbi:c754437a-a7c5-4e41-aac9-8e2718e5ad86-CDS [Sclerotinia trifoliorum]|uniref:C754437a-a7c5-4e41-aac9-8e2718e5ad86-CDS n=1 Tax=Sclerotinia trifoliorum TaxID=28548 RepID=A0A8H2ZUE7_9HELO|nr:c754437a-a7c5-4e41-aac9-8e2718e5ad86-CDS [Sclerotinia trifoliorum]